MAGQYNISKEGLGIPVGFVLVMECPGFFS